MRLTSDVDLAAEFGITVEKLHDLRKRYGWPHVRLSRFDFRFTDEQIAEIVASRSVSPSHSSQAASTAGLTERSARRATSHAP